MECLQCYITKKHGLTPAKLKYANLAGLHHTLKTIHPYNRASLVELIHRWIPTIHFLQISACPRCGLCPETAQHINQCEAVSAITYCQDRLYKFFMDLVDLNSSISILQTFEDRLTTFFNVSSPHQYLVPKRITSTCHHLITEASHHQNILGWDNFCRRYISGFWY
jgi:hypothetical protein